MTLDVLAVAGCRPNFVKLAPLIRAMDRRPSLRPLLVHTGQHYDHALSDVFFRDLDLPEPDVHLGVGSGSQAVQTARVLEGMERVLLDRTPDLVLVVGDVNSTVAAALAAVKLGIPVAHVEAGLRSFDREMPEEVNRMVTDSLSSFLFVSEPSGVENLRREGADQAEIHLVGNVMVDALLINLEKISSSGVLERWGLEPGTYGVLTLHRPDNVDDREVAAGVVAGLLEVQRELPLIFPVHPRTRERFERMGLWDELDRAAGLLPVEPLGYLDFLGLVRHAALVLTDSGGLQEETTALGVPCLTLRHGTERPATVSEGTNRIVGKDPERIATSAREALANGSSGRAPDLWDGKASERIVDVLLDQTVRIETLYRNLRERSLCAPSLKSNA